MKIVYNDLLRKDLKEFLLSQKGINNVKIVKRKEMDSIIINSDLAPNIVAKYIDLFQDNEYATMFSFDKGGNSNLKKLVYHVDDACCEYCHMYFIRSLFDNNDIVSVNSNFSLDNSTFNIEYDICYLDTVDESIILEYIKSVYND